MIDLDEADAKGKAATPGPWHVGQQSNWKDDIAIFGDLCVSLTAPRKLTRADAEFIAYARNNWPAIVDEIRELRRLNAELLTKLEMGDE